MELKNKVVIITGISKGIGKSLCELCLSRGAKVYGLGIHAPDYAHESLVFISTNVRKFEEVESAIQKILVKEDRIDVLVNNSGMGYFGYLEDMTLDQWHQMYQTNVDSIFYTCKMIVPVMKKQQFGHILNIASTAALEGMIQVSAYCGTKWAVKGITESLWRECRDFKVKVTCVYPGSTQTDFFKNSPGIQAHEYMLHPNDVALMMVHAIETPDNCHQVNLEIRPLQPKGPKK